MLEQYRNAIKKIDNQKTTSEFPNFFHGIDHKDSASGLEKYIQSVLRRTKIPHFFESKAISEDFFKHLTDHALKLAAESDCEIDIDLYVGGGVVRSLLGYAYKFLYQRAENKESAVLAPDEHYKSTLDAIDKLPDDSDSDALLKNQLKLRNIVNSSEFALKSTAMLDQKELLAPFVLGVGSDLDIYYDIKSKDGKPLMPKQVAAGNRIRYDLVNFINALEVDSGLRDNHNAIKHSLLPVADVKNYHEQMKRTVGQGGSLLDTLAFQLTPKINPSDSCFRLPEQHQDILNQFLDGSYEYLTPQKGKASQKQGIRGLRALLEIPFLNIKDTDVIAKELLGILDSMKQGKKINPQAVEQFRKMVRNANFELAHNRPYQAALDTPLNLGLQIAERIPAYNKIRRTIPSFLQKLPFDSDEVVKQGDLYFTLKPLFLSKENFEKDYTDNGLVFHGTSLEDGMSALRGGFVESNKNQGTAAFGPGAYMAKSYNAAAQYSTGLVLNLQITSENLNIITLKDIQKNWVALENEAREKHFLLAESQDSEEVEEEGIFNLLKNRNQYAIDIIIATPEYLVVQNLNALELEKNLEVILDWFYLPLVKWEADENQQDFKEIPLKILQEYIKFASLIEKLGGTLSVNKAPKNIFQKIFKKIESISERMNGSDNALTLAIQHKCKDIVELILRDYPEKANHIFSSGNNCGHNAFSYAIKLSDYKTAARILEYYPAQAKNDIADENNTLWQVIQHAPDKLAADLVRIILAQSPEQANHVASHGKYQGYNAIMVALQEKKIEVVKQLLEHAPESIYFVITRGPHNGENAFSMAIHNKIHVIKLLLKYNPELIDFVMDDNNGYEGQNALIYAMSVGKVDPDVIAFLLKQYPKLINFTIMDGKKKGHNAISLAIKNNKLEIAKKLLRHMPELNPITIFNSLLEAWEQQANTTVDDERYITSVIEGLIRNMGTCEKLDNLIAEYPLLRARQLKHHYPTVFEKLGSFVKKYWPSASKPYLPHTGQLENLYPTALEKLASLLRNYWMSISKKIGEEKEFYDVNKLFTALEQYYWYYKELKDLTIDVSSLETPSEVIKNIFNRFPEAADRIISHKKRGLTVTQSKICNLIFDYMTNKKASEKRAMAERVLGYDPEMSNFVISKGAHHGKNALSMAIYYNMHMTKLLLEHHTQLDDDELASLVRKKEFYDADGLISELSRYYCCYKRLKNLSINVCIDVSNLPSPSKVIKKIVNLFPEAADRIISLDRSALTIADGKIYDLISDYVANKQVCGKRSTTQRVEPLSAEPTPKFRKGY